MLGKKVLNNVYWHSSLTLAQTEDVQQQIAAAENLANLQADTDYNVVKDMVKNNFPEFGLES
jgi:trans-2-enoyl-CoA reductase